MSETQSMMITTVTVNGEGRTLPAGESVAALMREIEDAIRSGGRFVEVPDADGRPVHLLMSPGTRVEVSTRAVGTRDQDDDDDHLYDSHLDDFS